jgi:hypothetical protein
MAHVLDWNTPVIGLIGKEWHRDYTRSIGGRVKQSLVLNLAHHEDVWWSGGIA